MVQGRSVFDIGHASLSLTRLAKHVNFVGIIVDSQAVV